MTREQQIHLMVTAPERHAAFIERMKNDPKVTALLSAKPQTMRDDA